MNSEENIKLLGHGAPLSMIYQETLQDLGLHLISKKWAVLKKEITRRHLVCTFQERVGVNDRLYEEAEMVRFGL